jgi:hypothetical protein
VTEYTGGFLGLVPDNAGQLAVDGGDPPEQMHLTLLYLGDNVADWAPEQSARLRELVTASAPAFDPVDARIMGHAIFNPDGGDSDDGPQPCAVYLVGDSPALNPLRKWAQWVTTTHDDYPTPPAQHDPVIFHVTAGYGLNPDQLTFTGPVRFSTLRLALAGDVLDVPLGDAEAPVITETKSGEITFTPPAEIIEVAAILPGPVARLVAEGKALNTRGVDWVGANCGEIGLMWAASMRERALEVKRDISTDEREKLAKQGHTLKGTKSYPIKTLGDLDNAYQSWGRAKPGDRDALKRLLLKEARRLNAGQEMIDKIQDLGSGEDDGDADDKSEHKGLNMGRRVGADGDPDDDPALQSIQDLHNAIGAHHKLPPEKRKANARRLKGAAKRLGADHHITQRIGSLEQATTEGKSLEDGIEVKVASPDPRAAKLRNFWAFNPKGRKKWRPGSKGDFKRLRRHLAKFVHNPKVLNGLTANIHKMATGQWPGKNAHTLKGNVGKPLTIGVKFDWSEDIETKAAAMAVDTDPEIAALFDGIDDWGQQFDEPWTAGYIADLGDEADGPDGEPDGDVDDGTGVLLDTARHAQLAARMIPDSGPGGDVPDASADGGDAGEDSGSGLPDLFDVGSVSA